MSYGNQNTWSGDSIFEDVYIYGTLYYEGLGDFENLEVGTLYVRENSYFGGIATFMDDIDLRGELNAEYLTVVQRLNVGVGGSILHASVRYDDPSSGRVGVGNSTPLEGMRLQVGGPNTMGTGEAESTAFVVTGLGTVGIGTTRPGSFAGYDPSVAGDGVVKLDVNGSIKIERNIYDSADSAGVNGYYLNRDAHGIRWIEASPIAMEGIFVQDEGVYLPTVGTAQTFSTINFWGTNSLGLGTDNVIAIPDPDNPTNIARIQTQDLWGYTTTGDVNSPIYRMTKVGIKNNNPSKELDVTGEVHVTGNVDFDSVLNVDGDTFLNAALDVDGNTTLNNALDVDGATTLNNTLDVDGQATFNDSTDATSTTSGSVQIDGGVGIQLKLYVGGNTKVESAVDSVTTGDGALVVVGGVGIGKKLNVGGDTKIEGTTQSTTKDNGALIVEGGAGIEKKLNIGGA